MSVVLIHLSDIHFRINWDENHGVVFRAFFDDLNKQLQRINTKNLYFVLSGDVVQSGEDSESYNQFFSKFDSELELLGIPKKKRICVPGNHDVATKRIELRKVDHEGVISQNLSESSFNDYAERPSTVFRDKFSLYSDFENRFADYGSLGKSLGGSGWEVENDVGVYCINTAFFSTGGIKDGNPPTNKDRKRLAIYTRGLHSWNQTCKARCKILVMHHPLAWLTGWAEKEVRSILNKDFALCLSGHSHDQSVFHFRDNNHSIVEVSAPPLFTNKTEELGYSFVVINENKEVSDIIYRQWTKRQSFVPGVNFSNTEDGKVIINSQSQEDLSRGLQERKAIDIYLSQQLNDSLEIFTSQPKIWVEPIISTCSELDRDCGTEKKMPIVDLIRNPSNTIIKAPPQFGLTCLAHYLIREAWRQNPASLWLYLDTRKLKPSENYIKKASAAKLNAFGREIKNVDCVILDSWKTYEKNAYRLLSSVCQVFKGLPIIVMHTIDNVHIIDSLKEKDIDEKFNVLFLWTLSREKVRSVVTIYNDARHIGDEDAVTSKVVSDLDTLNIHRTPLNCLTVLKASEMDFDESPVNRTELLRRVLFLLFNVDEVPKYKNKPDMQDCEYVLGYFCESMIRENNYLFSRERFITTLERFCKSRVMDLDVVAVFDILYVSHILIQFEGQFCFKFSYWLYYFAAQRMHHDNDFAQFVFSNMHYARFPEVMEFYTGIDRRRNDAISVLIEDLRKANKKMQDKYSIPDEIDPYKYIQWKPSQEMQEQMQKELREGVADSKLPTAIKDRYADIGYDKRLPYFQEIRDVLGDISFVSLMLGVKAAARALRNSDYVSPDNKRNLLSEILYSWKQIAKLLLVLGPILAERGNVTFDGIMFYLDKSYNKKPEERFREILMYIPYNIISWYKDDLFSHKMGPLLFEQLDKDGDDIIRHELILLIIDKRPRGWKEVVEKYIGEVKKNSFFLMDIMRDLRAQYVYSYASPIELHNIENLIKMSAAKHAFGTKKPGERAIKKIPDTVLPEREVQ